MGTLGERVAIVTGAGRGVGRATALRLAREGAAVVVNDLDESVAEETVDLITAEGGVAVSAVADLTEPSAAAGIVQQALESFGGIDILVNNAGWVEVGPIREINLERWRRMLAINLDSAYQMLQAVGGEFIRLIRSEASDEPRWQRKIVNVSSMAGLAGTVGSIHYAAAKAGVVGMTLAAAKEWGRHQVNVNAVAFGVIDTRLTMATADPSASTLPVTTFDERQRQTSVNSSFLRRSGRPEEAAAAIHFLCSPDSDFVSGVVLPVAGGR